MDVLYVNKVFSSNLSCSQIIYLDPNGLAASHGLTPFAEQGDARCNWFITEINNRPLSLFFKDSEVSFRNILI